jgi:hypothetical protein
MTASKPGSQCPLLSYERPLLRYAAGRSGASVAESLKLAHQGQTDAQLMRVQEPDVPQSCARTFSLPALRSFASMRTLLAFTYDVSFGVAPQLGESVKDIDAPKRILSDTPTVSPPAAGCRWMTVPVTALLSA